MTQNLFITQPPETTSLKSKLIPADIFCYMLTAVYELLDQKIIEARLNLLRIYDKMDNNYSKTIYVKINGKINHRNFLFII